MVIKKEEESGPKKEELCFIFNWKKEYFFINIWLQVFLILGFKKKNK